MLTRRMLCRLLARLRWRAAPRPRRTSQAQGRRDLLDPRRLVSNVGGDRVEVDDAGRPERRRACLSPSPADAKTVARRQGRLRQRARLRGLDDAAGQGVRHQGADRGRDQGHQAAQRRRTSHGHAMTDPHAWQSVANAKIYVANIRDALIAADPAGKDVYEANAARLSRQARCARRGGEGAIAKIPADRRRIITTPRRLRLFRRRLRHRVHRAAGRLDRSRGLGRGRGAGSSPRSGSRRSRRCSWRTSPIRG